MNTTPTEQQIRESFRRDFHPDGTPRDNLMDNAQAHVNELRDWLASHPRPTTAQGRMARADRERALIYWLRAIAREEVRQ